MQNFGMNDIVAMFQQFGANGGNVQKYIQAFQQINVQGNQPTNMFQAYKQFRKNLGMQGDLSEEDFQKLKSQADNLPPEQLNQMKTALNQQMNGTPTVEQQMQSIQAQIKPSNGGI